MNLQNLSTDVTNYLFDFLSSKELVNIAKTRKEFFFITENERFKYKKKWRYWVKIENQHIGDVTDIHASCKIDVPLKYSKFRTQVKNSNTFCRVPINLDKIKDLFDMKLKDYFYNCNTYIIRNKRLRIFNNGAIQLTCKNIDDCIEILEYFCDKIKIKTEQIINFKIDYVTTNLKTLK